MLQNEKIKELRNKIIYTLIPLIDSDYIFLELPYYSNVGDLLIWKGEEDFLKQVEYKCLLRSSFHTFSFPNISANTIILLQGGGNWGDMWDGEKTPHSFRRRIAEKYPNNKIIVFPQTVFYKNEKIAHYDAELFGKCKRLTICARDNVSYNYLRSIYTNDIILLPDMAFCIEDKFLEPYRNMRPTRDALYLVRQDCELNKDNPDLIIDGNVDIADWPTMNEKRLSNRIISLLLWRHPHLVCNRLVDFYFQNHHFPLTLHEGISFICSYGRLYSTRLHVAILCVLLGKECKIIDNSYGKNRNFFNTWLENTDGISML